MLHSPGNKRRQAAFTFDQRGTASTARAAAKLRRAWRFGELKLQEFAAGAPQSCCERGICPGLALVWGAWPEFFPMKPKWPWVKIPFPHQ